MQEISSRIGLWSDEREFMLVTWTGSGSLTKAMSNTSGLYLEKG